MNKRLRSLIRELVNKKFSPEYVEASAWAARDNHTSMNEIQKEISAMERLLYLRGEIEAERISYGEIAELQSLVEYIDPGDVLLLEWAGVEENK